MKYFDKGTIIAFMLIPVLSFKAVDNPHFYRATNIFLEPKIEHDFVSTWDMWFSGGSTDSSRNSQGKRVPLGDIYGMNSFISPKDGSLIEFSCQGKFNIQETNLWFMQNFTRGFFSIFHLPVRNLEIHNVDIVAVSDHVDSMIIKDLKTYSLEFKSTNRVGSGDFTLLTGWTHNYQHTKVLDFIDGTIAGGILFPTGKRACLSQPLSLPLGYDGHWGFPFSIKASCGMYEWITGGFSLETIFFVKNHQRIRFKGSADESGLVSLMTKKATVHKGAVWDAGLFLKADHFMYGCSFTIAYSCAGQQELTVVPFKSYLFNPYFINADPRFKAWRMHTLHFLAEYDFAKQDSHTGLRIGIFYNYQLAGVRVFDTNMTGGMFGIDATWGF